MNNKVLVVVIAVAVFAGTAFYLQSNSSIQTTSSDSSAFENNVAAILSSTSLSDQAKLAQLAANLRARLAAKKLRAAQSGINLNTVPPTAIPAQK